MKWKCLFSGHILIFSWAIRHHDMYSATQKTWLGCLFSSSPVTRRRKNLKKVFFFFHIFELLWVGGERKGPLMPRKQCAYIKERANQFTRGNESETEQRRQSNPIGPPLFRPSSFLQLFSVGIFYFRPPPSLLVCLLNSHPFHIRRCCLYSLVYIHHHVCVCTAHLPSLSYPGSNSMSI